MDINYADKNGIDQGALLNYYLDIEANASSEGNTFEGNCSVESSIIKDGGFIYVEGTEYGGIIDSIKIDTAKKIVYHKGRNWRGVLASKIISPNEGEDYYMVMGDLNTALSQIISRVDLSDFFVVETSPSGIETSAFKFRYIDAYAGITKMLAQNGAKLYMEWKKGKIHISAVPIVDFSKEKEIGSDLFDFVIEQAFTGVNHIIGLGRGELAERQVVHKYVDANGNVSDVQSFYGKEEICKVYDYANCESLEELEEKVVEELLSESNTSKIKVSSNNIVADIGDKFTVTDIHTGISVTQYVVNKIITIQNGEIKINYKVGDVV